MAKKPKSKKFPRVVVYMDGSMVASVVSDIPVDVFVYERSTSEGEDDEVTERDRVTVEVNSDYLNEKVKATDVKDDLSRPIKLDV
jgi:hypothetical protein